jgi:hypothetical protein
VAVYAHDLERFVAVTMKCYPVMLHLKQMCYYILKSSDDGFLYFVHHLVFLKIIEYISEIEFVSIIRSVGATYSVRSFTMSWPHSQTQIRIWFHPQVRWW